MSEEKKTFEVPVEDTSVTAAAKRLHAGASTSLKKSDAWRFTLREMFAATACFAVALYLALGLRRGHAIAVIGGDIVLLYASVSCSIAILTKRIGLSLATGAVAAIALLILAK